MDLSSANILFLFYTNSLDNFIPYHSLIFRGKATICFDHSENSYILVIGICCCLLKKTVWYSSIKAKHFLSCIYYFLAYLCQDFLMLNLSLSFLSTDESHLILTLQMPFITVLFFFIPSSTVLVYDLITLIQFSATIIH